MTNEEKMTPEEAIAYGKECLSWNQFSKDMKMYQFIEMAIKALSQEPKTGKWIVHEKPHGIRYLECSYCNIWYLNEHLIRNSYCPNCGAKMQESEDQE
ncbi:MAG: hypothetical protein IIY21_10010 [Clostridiales bacterium]|nr:hypothetical protein [Clostridiales bacterium]